MPVVVSSNAYSMFFAIGSNPLRANTALHYMLASFFCLLSSFILHRAKVFIADALKMLGLVKGILLFGVKKL